MANENKNSSAYRAYFFAFFSVVLLILSAWVIWDDEFGLRPWKHYQKEYKSLKHDQLEKEYKQAQLEFHRSGGAKRLADLTAQLEKAEAALKDKGTGQKYEQLNRQLEELQKQSAASQ